MSSSSGSNSPRRMAMQENRVNCAGVCDEGNMWLEIMMNTLGW